MTKAAIYAILWLSENHKEGVFLSELAIIQGMDEDMEIGNIGRRKYKKQQIDKEEINRTIMEELSEGNQFRVTGGTLFEHIEKIEAGAVDEDIVLVLSGNRSRWAVPVSQVASKDFKGKVFVIIAKIIGSEKNFEITLFPKTKKGYIVKQAAC